MRRWFILSAVGRDRPGIVADLAQLVFDSEGEVRRYVRIFVNEEALNRDAADTSVGANDRIQVVASAAGG